MLIIQHALTDEDALRKELDRARARLSCIVTEDRMGMIGRKHGRSVQRVRVALLRFIDTGHHLFASKERTNRLLAAARRCDRG